jgi:hypothetical protein
MHAIGIGYWGLGAALGIGPRTKNLAGRCRRLTATVRTKILEVLSNLVRKTKESSMKTRCVLCTRLWPLVGLSVFAIVAVAQPSGGEQGSPGSGGRRHGPPPEAIAACKGKTAGAECSFTGRQNDTITGTCFAPPARRTGPPNDQTATNTSPGNAREQGDLPLACRPARGAPGGGPPPQH